MDFLRARSIRLDDPSHPSNPTHHFLPSHNDHPTAVPRETWVIGLGRGGIPQRHLVSHGGGGQVCKMYFGVRINGSASSRARKDFSGYDPYAMEEWGEPGRPPPTPNCKNGEVGRSSVSP